MDCIEFRTFYKKYTNYPIAKAICETEHYQSWQEHNDECSECSDWCLIESLKDKGVNCSGQVKLATVLSFSQYSRSDSLGVKPPLY